MDKYYVCQGCGHVEFDASPAKCPVCATPGDKYKEDAAAVNPAEKEGKEKHVPVILVTRECGLIPGECSDIHIKVGSTPHPMQEDHWIQWIDVYNNKKYVARHMLTPSMEPAVSIHIKRALTGKLQVIESCNKHGKWTAEAELL